MSGIGTSMPSAAGSHVSPPSADNEDMVALALERAPGAAVMPARAEDLPFADSTFTAFAMSIVFFFLDDR